MTHSPALTFQDLEANAARGAALLDSLDSAWFWRVDPAVLDMAGGSFEIGDCGCVLAQLNRGRLSVSLGWYTDEVRRLFESTGPELNDDAEAHGFLIKANDDDDLDESRYDALTNIWRALIADRRAATA